MHRFSGFDKFTLALIVIGALNWALIGFFQYDLVASMFGGVATALSRIIYVLIGLAGLWCLTLFFRRGEEAR